MRTSKPRSLRFSSLSTVPYSRKVQWPTCNFLLPCVASMRTQAYCFTTVLYIKNENLLLHHNSQTICIELCMSGLILSVTKTTKKHSDYPIATRHKRAELDLSFSPSVSDTTEPGNVDLRRLQGVDGQGSACPPVAYISDLIRVSSHISQLAGK